MIRRWEPGALLHPPAGREWWYAAGYVVVDRTHLWWLRPDGSAWSAAGRFTDVHPADGGFVAWSPTGGVVADAAGMRAIPGIPMSTGAVTQGPAGWIVAGIDLPEGAERAAHLWPAPDGSALWWWADHFLYRRDADGIRAVASADDLPLLAVGPAGAAVVDGRHGIAPGGAVVPLAARIDAGRSTRFAADGRVVAGATADGDTATLDLETGRVLSRTPGQPVDLERRWDAENGTVGDLVGIHETTPALHGDLLAGPGGAIWDLAVGRRLSPYGVVPLGVTLPAADGFVVAHWQSGVATAVAPDGAPRWTCTIPLVHEEVLVRGAPPSEIVTSEGVAWAVGPRGATRLDKRSKRPKSPPLPPTDIPVDGVADVGGAQWGWRDDGLLVRLGPTRG